jgi:hypothetical protein
MIRSQGSTAASQSQWLQPLLGGLSGLLMEGSLHPLDTIRTRMKTNTATYSPLVAQVKNMYRSEGLRSYFKGFSCTFVSSFVCNGFYFFTYENLKSLLKTQSYMPEKVSPFIAGFFAGFTCDFLYMPFDLVRARMQMSNNMYDYKNVFDGLGKMWRREGLRSLRNCGSVYFALSGVQAGFTFGFYEIFNNMLKPAFKATERDGVNLPLTIVSSVTAASVASCLANPLDVMVTRKQTSNRFVKTTELIRDIYRAEGCRGFMKGVSGTVSYFALASAILFPTYEVLKSGFNVDFSEEY